MKPNKGLRRDESFNDAVSGSWRYALNLSLSLGSNDIQNEDGTVVADHIGTDNKIIGITKANNKLIICSVLPNTQQSEIGIYDGYTYETKIKSNYLGFSVYNPIKGVAGYDSNGDLIFVFTDATQEHPKADTNILRYINLDNLPFELDANYELVDSYKIDLLNLIPNIEFPIIQYRQNQYTGGTLKSGAYYYFICYELSDGFYTDWMGCSQPVIVHNGSKTNSWEEIEGSPVDFVTSKAIELAISNIDTRYNRYKIAYLHKSGGQFTSQVISINSTTNNIVTHTGNEFYEQVSLEQLFISNMAYTKAKSLAVLDNNLYLISPEIDDDIRYQKYANNIEVNWITDTVGLDSYVDSYKNPFIVFTKKSFMPGDIYALYGRFRLKNGKVSKCFHIPGRVPITNLPAGYNDLDNSQNEVALDIYSGAKLFHLENTATKVGSNYGKMGYWENASEEYPNDDEYDGTTDYDGNALGTVDLRGQKVRHHKFPSLLKLKQEGIDFMSHNAGTTLFSGTAWLNNAYSNIQYYIHNAIEVERKDFEDDVRVLAFTNYTHDENVIIEDDIFYEGQGTMRRYNTVIKATRDITVNYDINIRAQFNRDSSPGNQRITAKIAVVHRLAVDDSETDLDAITGGDYDNGIEGNIDITLDATRNNVNMKAGDRLIVRGSCWTVVHEDERPVPVDTGFTGDFKVDVNIIDTVSTELGTILGIKLLNVEYPAEILEKATHFELLYAKRTTGNSTILGQALITEVDTDGDGNKFCREHSFDLLNSLSALNITHAERLLKYDYDWLTGTATTTPKNTIIYNTEQVDGFVVESEYEAEPLVKITDSKYLQRDNSYLNPSNENKEDCIYHRGVFDDGGETPVDDASDDTAKYTLANFCSFKLNVYNSFLNQQLVSTGAVFSVNNKTNNMVAFGGDCHVSLYGVTRYVGEPVEPTDENAWGTGNEFHYHLYPCFSVANIGLQHHGKELEEIYFPYFNLIDDEYGRGSSYEGIGNITDGSKWRKIIDASGGTIIYSKDFPSYIGYNTDYNSVNDIYAVQEIFDPSIEVVTKFPHRVASSLLLPAEGSFVGWRIFPAASYIEMPKDRGVGWDLIVDNKDLLVSMKYGLFVFKKKDELDVDDTTIAFGSANLFENKPEEVMYGEEDGTIGNQCMFASASSTNGIIFVDKERGRIFLYNKYKAREISALGMAKFFDTNIRYNSTDAVPGSNDYLEDFNEDNPYQGNGIQCVWDNKLERYILNKKADVSFTISFSPTLNYIQDIGYIGGWLSFHSYNPIIMFTLNKELYSIKRATILEGEIEITSDVIFKHTGNKGQFYGTYYETKLDLIINNPNNINKLFDSVQWANSILSSAGNPIEDTFSKIIIFTNDKHSDLITLVEQGWDSGNVRKTGGNWHFSQFRDVLKTKSLALINDLDIDELAYETIDVADLETDWTKKSWFKCEYIIVRMIFTNASNKSLILHDFSVNATPRKRF